MKQLLLFFVVTTLLGTLSCNKDSADENNFEKILGTYSGMATYDYHENVNNVYSEDHQEMQGSITVTAVSKSDLTFKITGTGFLANAYNGYDNEVYTWTPGKLNGNTYFAVNSKQVSIDSRDVSTRFNLSDDTVEMDYGEMIFAKTSTESIHFEGSK